MRKTRWLAPVLLLASVCLIGCADESGNGDDSGAPAESTQVTDGAAGVADGGEPTATSEPEPEVQPSELGSFLLELSDLPAGYSVVETEDSGDSHPCSDNNLLAEYPNAEVQFQQSTSGPFVLDGVAFIGSSLEAEAAMAAMRNWYFAECATWTNDDGQSNTYREASFPTIGDETLALQLSVEGSFLPVGGHLVAVREGPFIMVVAYVELSFGSDVELLESLVRKAHSKLP